ncbi:MAG TPA: hypothetical protein VH061_11370 [Solirubrobacteraceae bacterium]|nr:hypothetical protein [Solirubrobacteraceae bacterium]
MLRLAIRRRGRVACCLLALAGLAAVLTLGLPGHGVPRAAGLSGATELVAQTDDSVPATGVTLFGAAPEEAAGEVWGLAPSSGGSELVTYTHDGGWTLGPQLLDAGGEPLTNFHLDTPEAFSHPQPSPLAAQMTPAGAGAMLGTVGSGASSRDAVLVREPGQAFKEAPVPEGGEGLLSGEELFGINRPPLLAALDEPEGKAGAFVVPVAANVDGAVLHWDGTSWIRETIEIPPAGSAGFEVLSLGASSPQNAWLLARMEGSSGPLTLFRRHAGATPQWRPVATQSGGGPGEPIEILGERFDVPPHDQAQLLTVTSDGVWVDGRLHGANASATLYFKPDGEADTGSFTGLWCEVPDPTGVSPGVLSECSDPQHSLPEALPTEYSRSFAWSGSGSFGERIVTGLKDGQMLRLEGGRLEAVNSLGSEAISAADAYGAAFASSSEGWLGKRLLPVHVTSATSAVPSRLQPWPVPFRSALTAVAPEPGAPVGGESSEAIAVGDRGEVARFHPNCPAQPLTGGCEGAWLPETLPGPAGKRQSPRLRAVAWPTPSRVYAVGDAERGAGQMWLWRGETGLWEKDPGIPLNFRGNLLGIAFDPEDSTRGYAVGQQGVLLSYGKSWTQEEEAAIPVAARGASFTSIAFAGSEAIVAWRKLVRAGQNQYAGGVIVNEGSGWREEEGAAALLGTVAVPWAVAGLPDGGAAFTAKSPTQGATLYERSNSGSAWQGFPYPGGFAPGSLSLFREGGTVRAVATGSEPATFVAEEEAAPPAGAAPILVDPYPLVSDPDRGVLRQTAGGWNDEEHELNNATEVPGGYVHWDTPKIPDPVNALLVDPAGGEGWAVGGFVNNKHALLDTADIFRYPAESRVPPGTTADPETTSPGYSAFAIGGGAGCAAPCATRSDTGTGPSVWLQSAIKEASQITSVHTFLYTGPGVTDGLLTGPRLFPVPWQAEERSYLARAYSLEPLVCLAPSPTDREGGGEGSAAFFEQAFASVGGGTLASACEGESGPGGSYAFDREKMRVIVLDTSFVAGGQRELAGDQIDFLREQFERADEQWKGRSIVIGNADLPREVAEGHAPAQALASAIVAGGAAAYFFESPEQNVSETLSAGTNGIPAYGTGTLGYVNVLAEEGQGGFIGQSGFLVAQIAEAETSEKAGEAASYHVHVKLVPNIEELAVEAQQGTLLRRSQAASFAGLARRPRAGNRAHNQSEEVEVAPYIPIPDNCLGADCARGIAPEYSFESSNTEDGEFVKRNIHSAELNAVEHDSHGKPISQEAEGGKDGLFCAFNSTPTNEPVYIRLKVANLRYSLPVTIQAGSVSQPCGTTVLHRKPATTEANPAPPPAGSAPASGAAPTALNVPVPQAGPPAPAPAHPHAPPSQFLPQTAPVAFLPAFVPVPLPTPARPTPPSGTSPVTSPVEAAQKEEEEEAAPESVDAAASAYHPSEHETPPVYLLGLVVLAAFAGASLRGRRGPRRGTRVAPATVNSGQAQRRWERDNQRNRW